MKNRRLILQLSEAEFLQLAMLAQRRYTSPLVLARRAIAELLAEGQSADPVPDLAALPSRALPGSEQRGKHHLPRYLRRFMAGMPDPLAVIAHSETPVADATAGARALTQSIDRTEPLLAEARVLLTVLLLFTALETPDFAREHGLSGIWTLLREPEPEFHALLAGMIDPSRKGNAFLATEAPRFERLPPDQLQAIIALLLAHPAGFFDGRE